MLVTLAKPQKKRPPIFMESRRQDLLNVITSAGSPFDAVFGIVLPRAMYS